MKIAILKGIYASNVADFVQSPPVNREPVIMETGLSSGYLRPAPGIVGMATLEGPDRGGINWNGTCYRVVGTELVTVGLGGGTAVLGDVGSGGQCWFDYSPLTVSRSAPAGGSITGTGPPFRK